MRRHGGGRAGCCGGVLGACLTRWCEVCRPSSPLWEEGPLPAGARGQHGSGRGGAAGCEGEVAGLALALEVSPQGFARRCSRFPRADPAPSPKACPQVSVNHPDTVLMVPGASTEAARVCSGCLGWDGGDSRDRVCLQLSEAVAHPCSSAPRATAGRGHGARCGELVPGPGLALPSWGQLKPRLHSAAPNSIHLQQHMTFSPVITVLGEGGNQKSCLVVPATLLIGEKPHNPCIAHLASSNSKEMSAPAGRVFPGRSPALGRAGTIRTVRMCHLHAALALCGP